MTREALTAALDDLDENDPYAEGLIHSEGRWDCDSHSLNDHGEVVVAAARERLAQLPEICGTCEGTHPFDLPGPICPTCHGSGKVYPAELVERIATVICHHQHLAPQVPCQPHRTTAVAVLDALNGETP